MQQPRLTFACELDPARLTALFSDAVVIADLQALGAHLTLAFADLSPEHAAIVRHLNAAGIPLVACLLLPQEEGYFLNADNAPEAVRRYADWKTWTTQHGLVWEGVGLDIEPHKRIFQQIVTNRWRLLPTLLPRLRDGGRVRRAQVSYAALVAQIHADGYSVESYQFPFIGDERRAGSTLLQRLFGLVDVTADREVWMIYTSTTPFLRTLNLGLLWSYASEAAAVAVGSTGSVEVPDRAPVPPLDWDELVRDLRLARYWCDDLFIHSLEGCVQHGILGRLRSFEWGPAVPPETTRLAERLRGVLLGLLWASAHPWRVLSSVVATAWLISRWRRRV